MSSQTGGRLVCVMGIDGSGKSTASAAAVELLRERGIDAGYLWNRWEPLALAPLMGRSRSGAFRGSASDADEDHYARKRRLLAGSSRRTLWLWAASCDYALRGVTRARRALSENAVVLCDRYTPDFIVDQAMNIDGTLSALAEVMRLPTLRLFPRAIGHVLLDIEAVAAIARKDEGLPQRTVADKIELYRAYAQAVGAVTLDASRDAGAVAVALAEAVEACLARVGR